MDGLGGKEGGGDNKELGRDWEKIAEEIMGGEDKGNMEVEILGEIGFSCWIGEEIMGMGWGGFGKEVEVCEEGKFADCEGFLGSEEWWLGEAVGGGGSGKGKCESWKIVDGSLKLREGECGEEFLSTCTWKGKLVSSKITWREIRSFPEDKSKQRYPLWDLLYPRKTHLVNLACNLWEL